MKITLRKKDSVTSIVLFIFNIYGEYRNKHEIGLSHLIEFMKCFGKSEVSIRTGLSRMVKSNILINKRKGNELVYELTKEGLDNVMLWNKGLSRFFKRYELRWKEWNNRWDFLILIDFNKSDPENQFIVDELKESGLREAGSNIWVTAYTIEPELISLVDRYKYMLLKSGFETNMDMDDLLESTFKLSMIRESYIEFTEKLTISKEKMKSAERGQLLPILFELGWDFYDIVTYDPALPKQLLDSWEGDRAVNEMRSLRELLTKEIRDFFDDRNA